MDDKTKTMMLTLAASVVKNGLMALGSTAATHGIINGNQTETFVAIGMALVGGAWSFWNSYGRAIVLSQLEVLKAKSLAQAAAMRQSGVPPVTAVEIANESPTLTPAEVVKTVATLPPAIQANVKGVVVTAALVLLAVMLAFPGDAMAQIKKPQFTGDFSADAKANLGLGSRTPPTSNDPLQNIIGALDAKLLPDLQYAKTMADASGSKVTGPCYGAWIDLINVRQKAVSGTDGTPLPFPDPGLISRFEQIVELRNALQPDSEFMIRCSPVASMVKKDIVGFIGIVISGGAGLATLVPGL